MEHKEDDLQMACVRWFDLQFSVLSWALFHVPNGGFRNRHEAARFKAMGVRSGVPDLLLLIPCRKYNYLAIELKAGKNTQTPAQKLYEGHINANGGKYVVVRSVEQFIDEVKTYLRE